MILVFISFIVLFGTIAFCFGYRDGYRKCQSDSAKKEALAIIDEWRSGLGDIT